jgi:hypothetical protein
MRKRVESEDREQGARGDFGREDSEMSLWLFYLFQRRGELMY